jgi:hypothetical protein
MTTERSDPSKPPAEAVPVVDLPPRTAADRPSMPLPPQDEDALPIEDLPPRKNVTGG